MTQDQFSALFAMFSAAFAQPQTSPGQIPQMSAVPPPPTAKLIRLANLLPDFRASLVARNCTTQHCDDVTRQTGAVLHAGQIDGPDEYTTDNVAGALAKIVVREKLSNCTRNKYLAACKQFSKWLVKRGHLTHCPLGELERFNPALDRQHPRRHFTADEFSRLLAAATTGRVAETLTGRDRVVLYCLSAWTGLRRTELGSLTPDSFHLDLMPAQLVVEAAYSKRKRRDLIVLHPAITTLVADYLAGRPPNRLVWQISEKVPGGKNRKTSVMIDRDLKRAEIPKRNRDGILDFHSLRHTFCTALARAGVIPKTAQALARHSTIALTLDLYTHTDSAQLADAIALLPPPILPPHFQASGGRKPTDSKTENSR